LKYLYSFYGNRFYINRFYGNRFYINRFQGLRPLKGLGRSEKLIGYKEE